MFSVHCLQLINNKIPLDTISLHLFTHRCTVHTLQAQWFIQCTYYTFIYRQGLIENSAEYAVAKIRQTMGRVHFFYATAFR